MISKLTLIFAAFFGVTSCSNALRDFPNKSSDSYYIDLARIDLNAFNFTGAIDKITPVLTSQPQNEDVVQIAMLAHAGRAGLRVLDLILALGTDASSSTFFRIFAEHFPNASDASVADVQKAIDILESYQIDPANRDTEMNLIGMFLYYSRIGVVLHRYAYVNNVISPSFNQCDVTNLPEAAVTSIVQSIPKAINSAAHISNAGGVSSALAALTNLPEIQAFLSQGSATCPASSVSCQSMRSLIGEGSLGIGLGSGNATVCP